DLDLTLDHGRIILTNDKEGPAKARVRFANPMVKSGQDSWDVTLLEKGASVGIELWGRYPPEIAFTPDRKKHIGPQTELYLFVLKGQAHVNVDDTTHGMEAPAPEPDKKALPNVIVWNSRLGVHSPQRLATRPPWGFSRYPPFPAQLGKEMINTLSLLRAKM